MFAILHDHVLFKSDFVVTPCFLYSMIMSYFMIMPCLLYFMIMSYLNQTLWFHRVYYTPWPCPIKSDFMITHVCYTPWSCPIYIRLRDYAMFTIFDDHALFKSDFMITPCLLYSMIMPYLNQTSWLRHVCYIPWSCPI